MNMKNSNPELNNIKFRKIKSLYFLYEISENGRIFRNIKSKKIYKQYKDYKGYWYVTVYIKGVKINKPIHSIVAECWLGDKPEGYDIKHIDGNLNNNNYRNLKYIIYNEDDSNKYIYQKIPVMIKYNNESDWKTFDNLKSCAEYISDFSNKPFKSVRWKLSKRRHNIFGFNIKYI